MADGYIIVPAQETHRGGLVVSVEDFGGLGTFLAAFRSGMLHRVVLSDGRGYSGGARRGASGIGPTREHNNLR
jgi:hypothetical protein